MYLEGFFELAVGRGIARILACSYNIRCLYGISNLFYWFFRAIKAIFLASFRKFAKMFFSPFSKHPLLSSDPHKLSVRLLNCKHWTNRQKSRHLKRIYRYIKWYWNNRELPSQSAKGFTLLKVLYQLTVKVSPYWIFC